MQNKITVSANIEAPSAKVWDYYTNPSHIVNWNFAHPSWHCPTATNDMKIGGTYKARMEAKDGSFGFDFEAIYSAIEIGKSFSYQFGERTAIVQFNDNGTNTEVAVQFDPESENPIEMQQEGWQAILNNFKSYVESN
ncbi:MAG TPA: SRPBCC domain-containing protein [Flavipsychrobacter sp.]|jgi:uncharacterized protein YndB with AHSA1/START domain|nr:SRPBCC domain-containing protein [Flavipsychrobacter sp.]